MTGIKTGGIAAVLAIVLSGCDKTSPSRDQVPVIRGQLTRLHTALQTRNVALLDSLVSPDLANQGLSVDSLMMFVWGAGGEKRFDHLGPNEIIYDKKKARINCSLIDSSGAAYREVTWTLIRQRDTWLLKRFETGVPPIDTAQ